MQTGESPPLKCPKCGEDLMVRQDDSVLMVTGSCTTTTDAGWSGVHSPKIRWCPRCKKRVMDARAPEDGSG